MRAATAWSAAAAALVLTAVGLALQVVTFSTPVPLDFASRHASTVVSLLYVVLPALGALIVSRQSQAPLAWMFITIGMTTSIWVLADGYAVYALLKRPGALPAAGLLAWLANWIWIVGWTVTGLMLLLFPDGARPRAAGDPSPGCSRAPAPSSSWPPWRWTGHWSTTPSSTTRSACSRWIRPLARGPPGPCHQRGDGHQTLGQQGEAPSTLSQALSWTLFALGWENPVTENLTQVVTVNRMAQLLGEATGAARTAVWLRYEGELCATAWWPEGEGDEGVVALDGDELHLPAVYDLAIPVHHQQELRGALTVTTRAGETVRPLKQALVSDLAAQAGHVLRNVRLTEEIVDRLDDLRASRERLVSAQDEERRRLERDLHDGAQQYLVALRVQLGLARAVPDEEIGELRSLLVDLEELAGEAIDSLRTLARGLTPAPARQDEGPA